ncbi:MAG: hypothetical protein KDN22_21505 [Verrucomicrobiae bacterium]|nr:hypothetical protein [Verrucomicrobiae bacterium]
MSNAIQASLLTLSQSVAFLLICSSALAQGDRAPEVDQRPRVEKLDDGTYRLGKIAFDQKTREVSFAAKVNMNLGYLEYILVNEVTGKTHESLLTTEVSPMDLNVVLLLLGYKPSSVLANQTEDKPLPVEPKASFDVMVKWKDSDGKGHTAPVESWVLNLATESPAVRGHWLYTGSKVDDQGGFAAETDGSIIAVYRDLRSLINNPREGKTSDEIWKPSTDQGLPPKETPLTIFLRPHAPEQK